MNRLLGLFSFCLVLIFFTLLWPKTVSAQEFFFNDEFNQTRPINTLDTTKWDIFPNDTKNFGTIREIGGNLILNQANSTPQFPLVISKNGLPDGDFSAEIKFRYNKVTPWGTGIALSEKAPTNGGDFNTLLTVNIWQDQSLNNMRVSFNGVDVYTTATNIALHTFKVTRTGLKYLVYFDNNLVYTSPDTISQTKYIWLGNPSFQNPSIPSWSAFLVDYIRVQAINTKTPVIFIPGIGGTQFKTKSLVNLTIDNGHGGIFTHTYPLGEKVWVNELEAAKLGEDDYFDILKLKSDGQTPEADLELISDNFAGVYQETINYFNNNGYTLNQNFFMFPYDWRKDISLTAPLLDQKIDQIKSQTGAQKVDIVAHSMGGLVARNYIQDPNKASKVRKLIELGVPHLGSTNSIKALRYGNCLTIPELANSPLCLGLTSSELKDVIQNMLGNYELIPTKTYFNFYSNSDNEHPSPFRDSADIDSNGITGLLNYDQIKTFLTNLGHNTSLFNPAEIFHHLDNNLPNTNGVETTIISGSGLPTLGQIIEKKINVLGVNLSKKDLLMINGDATVPLFSANLKDPFQNLSYLGIAKDYYAQQQHSNLAANGPALNLIKNILNNETSLPANISTQPFKLNGKQISVHSPINILVTDQNGHQTGITNDGNITQDIPGSFYETLDDAKFVWLPDTGIYQINLEATDNGSFDLKIRDFNNDINDKTILYKDISITSSSKAETMLDTTSTTLPIIELDHDGNDTIDQQISATGIIIGNEHSDNIPPEVQVMFNLQTQSLELSGLDNLGATSITELSNGDLLIKDLADNYTQINFDPQTKGKKDYISLNHITYTNNPSLNLQDNQFLVSYQENKIDQILKFTQRIILKGEEVATIDYNPKTNKSKITTKLPKQKKMTEEKDGIILLKLVTKDGDLDISY